jgi:serine/threonine protein kinase
MSAEYFDMFHDTVSSAEGRSNAFVTMELLAGESLADRLAREGRLTTAEALPIATQIASALAAAHRAGVIHRDLKSRNVMLAPSKDGGVRAVVTDFGLARALEPDGGHSSLTGGNGLVGTPDYMAPEQVEGGAVTPAADIYALGVVMYEMVTGTLPFVGDSPSAPRSSASRNGRHRPATRFPFWIRAGCRPSSVVWNDSPAADSRVRTRLGRP